MIFKPDAVQLIRERRKTQTRRTWKDCRVRVGNAYSVQPGRGQKGVVQITVVATRQERLGEINQQGARREGFQFVSQFLERWEELHGTPDLDQLVWVVTFAVGDLRNRFDRPRLLKATPGVAGDDVEEHQDYTEQPRLALTGEPEGVDAATLQYFTQLSRARDAHRAKDPDVQLHARLSHELEQWEHISGGSASDRDRQRAIDGVRRQLRTLERKLKVA